MLVVGLVLIVIAISLPLLALTGLAHHLLPASPDGVSNLLWVAFLGLAIGIPLSGLGCFLVAVAVLAHRYRR
jgi:hypothetical protein